MTTTTIRRTAFAKIAKLLSECVLIREVRIDDMGDTNGTVAAGRVMECGKEFEFDRVYHDEGSIHLSIHRGWFFVAYKSIEGARSQLTPQAFEKYFPQAG